MTTDIIIEELRKQYFNIVDTDDEKLKLYPLGNDFVLSLIYNGTNWETGDIEHGNGDGEVTVLAINEAEKFVNEFNKIKLDLIEELGDVCEVKAPEPKWSKPTKQLTKQKQMPVTMQDKQVQDLTLDDIKNYICPKASESEAFMFLKLCQARGLNPFTREAYLVKYGDSATMIVGKDAFAKRAEMHPEYDGFEAGIIIQNGEKELVYREGTFLLKTETLVGGWCRVYRKDRSKPFITEVSFSEYNTGKSLWTSKPATMIRKVAFVQGHREAFPSECSGMYDAAEMDENVSTSF